MLRSRELHLAVTPRASTPRNVNPPARELIPHFSSCFFSSSLASWSSRSSGKDIWL
ncbi:MAG: hypothetical protein AVDCRST_MAG10-2609 [uncultured Acidimicrobiales bacterium]|uniref:Uncharacterized protein n=1 Tax=uncultured Acidimicrobiales bacterium TaxID=310071 RepID=A0A6J4ISG1_9ACTN|nr:MAG: hypothetical protein AVDCRST_MAG10-2609 [uncultured Acidimicrobiales bacterium]